MLGRVKSHRGKIHIKNSLRRRCTPLVLTAIAVSVLIAVFFLTGISRGEAPGGEFQAAADPEHPQHRFLEGHSLLTQSEAAEPEKYFVTKVTSPEPLPDSSDSPQAKPKLGFYFQKDIPEHLLGKNAPAGILPQLQKVAKHKATEGKGGKMGFYFAHDIPEEIKATGDGSQSAGSANQQAGSIGKTLKQQQQQSQPRPMADPKQGTQRSQKQGRPLLQPLQTSPDPLHPQQRQFGKQQAQTDTVKPIIAQPGSQLRTPSTLGGNTVPPGERRGTDAHLYSQPIDKIPQSAAMQDTKRQGTGAGTSRGSVEVHRKLARDLPDIKPPLGYYFAVPEGVKAARSQLFHGDEAASQAEADLAGTKGPLGYYFSKDISDGAKRKGSWRARLLRSHLQPDAIHINPF
ncbi:hypothetical protein WJX74_010441 [Apatococcus lobatus]|uniref:Uncharacterized protein n=1 Tax=Apatococcus lobatus TaxID=904363 RepID=A0AAW1RW53_9CHLO